MFLQMLGALLLTVLLICNIGLLVGFIYALRDFERQLETADKYILDIQDELKLYQKIMHHYIKKGLLPESILSKSGKKDLFKSTHQWKKTSRVYTTTE